MKRWPAPHARRRPARKLIALASAAAVLPLSAAVVNPGIASSATAPPDCNSSFNPYSFTPAQLSACGITTFPQASTNGLAAGGSTVNYTVNGALVQILIPPAGFDPSTATATQLDQYGFPPPPKDPAAVAQWKAMLSTWAGSAPAPPFLAETTQTADTTLSDNWSGYEVTGPSGQFTLAQAHYDEPTFGSSRCSTNEESTWAGIGGAHLGDPLGQAGTAHNEPGLANHQAWWEVVPDVNTVAINLTTAAGHHFFTSTRRITGGYQFFVEDVATNTTQAVNAMINHYSGDSAEAIAERPTTSSGALADLSNFGTLTFLQSLANGNGINTYNPQGVRHGVHMTSNGLSTGTDLADPSAIGSGGSFTDTQHSCN
jgi:hypothetical protein